MLYTVRYKAGAEGRGGVRVAINLEDTTLRLSSIGSIISHIISGIIRSNYSGRKQLAVACIDLQLP
jgi:hypothetical protein